MAAPSQLSIYQGAVRWCGERKLASLSEERKSRRLLDDVWDQNGVKSCLEQGQWRFAMRANRITYDPDITPDFGYQKAFEKPSDLVRVAGVCSDEFFNSPILRITDEGDYWYSDLETIYVRYVSDDTDWGLDFAKWPQSFTEFVEAWFASKIITDLTQDEKKQMALLDPDNGIVAKLLTKARSNDAMKDPTKYAPPGSWTSSRRGGGGGYDGGSNSSLY